jgi:hypothetical protein
MTKAAADIPQMPPKSQLVREALESMAVDRKSKVFGIDSVTLHEFATLALRGEKFRADAIRWLRDELGDPGGEHTGSDATLYRFIEALEAAYYRQRKGFASRIARLSVDSATQGNIADMTRVGWNAAVELVTEALIATDDVEQVMKNLPKLIGTLSEAQHALDRRDKLELSERDLERRVAESEAKLALAEQRRTEIEQRLTQAQRRFDAEMKSLAAKKSGKSQITEEDIAEARRLVFGR